MMNEAYNKGIEDAIEVIKNSMAPGGLSGYMFAAHANPRGVIIERLEAIKKKQLLTHIDKP